MQATALLALLVPGLRWLGFGRACAALNWWASFRPEMAASDLTLERSRRTAALVSLAARHGLVPATCLEHSLALWALLRRQGIASNLRIGVRNPTNRLEAHAWVEHGAVVLNDTPGVARRFAAFDGAVVPEHGTKHVSRRT